MQNFQEDIRRYDYDRYLTSLFAPEKIRKKLYVLYAFNLEIAKIKEITSEQITGLIRLQWWREAIEEIYSGRKPRKQPVVEALAEIIAKHQLSHELFLKIINGRENDLDETPFKSIEDLENYAEEISSSLLILAANLYEKQELAEVLKFTGIAWCLASLLKTTALNMNKGFRFFPTDLLEKHAITTDKIKTSEFPELIKPVVKEIYDVANTNLEKSRQLLKDISKSSKKSHSFLLLYNVIAESKLKEISNKKFEVFKLSYGTNFLTLLKIYIASMTGRF